jgi:hypothetical protein
LSGNDTYRISKSFTVIILGSYLYCIGVGIAAALLAGAFVRYPMRPQRLPIKRDGIGNEIGLLFPAKGLRN